FILGIEQGANRCMPADIELRHHSSPADYEVRFNGEFSMNQCAFDLERCVITINAQEKSIYTCIDAKKDVDFNILNVETVKTANVFDWSAGAIFGNDLPSNIEMKALVDGETPDGDGWSVLLTDTLGGETVNIWFRFYAFTDCIAGVAQEPPAFTDLLLDFTVEWTMDIDCTGSDTGAQTSKWVNSNLPDAGTIALYATYFTILESCPWTNALYQFTDEEALFPSPVGGCWSVGINVVNNYLTEIPNGRKLSDVLLALIQRNTEGCDTPISSIASNFLQINPPSGEQLGNPIADLGVPYINYNFWIDPILFEISDVCYPDSETKSSVAIVTFKKLMSDLFKLCRLIWWVETDGEDLRLRIEHISQESFIVSPGDFSHIKGFNSWKYEREEYRQSKKFITPAQRNMDFVGTEITYEPLCTVEGVEEVVTEVLCADIDLIRSNPEFYHQLQAIVICSWKESSSRIWKTRGALSGAWVNNAAFSWANLHLYFHQHDAHTATGTLNNEEVTFFGGTVQMKVQELRMSNCDFVLDNYNYIFTEIGQGVIESVKTDLKTEMAQVTVKIYSS
ncbi:MAG: hypothetical protein JNM00_00885, partial [Flavobacteriales bacterium]|nr:hypothetical protein [Flavobacteriales bacterium]